MEFLRFVFRSFLTEGGHEKTALFTPRGGEGGVAAGCFTSSAGGRKWRQRGRLQKRASQALHEPVPIAERHRLYI